jgi:hypothetical protein
MPVGAVLDEQSGGHRDVTVGGAEIHSCMGEVAVGVHLFEGCLELFDEIILQAPRSGKQARSVPSHGKAASRTAGHARSRNCDVRGLRLSCAHRPEPGQLKTTPVGCNESTAHADHARREGRAQTLWQLPTDAFATGPTKRAYCTVQRTHHVVEEGVQLGVKILLRELATMVGLQVHQAVDLHLQISAANVGVNPLQEAIVVDVGVGSAVRLQGIQGTDHFGVVLVHCAVCFGLVRVTWRRRHSARIGRSLGAGTKAEARWKRTLTSGPPNGQLCLRFRLCLGREVGGRIGDERRQDRLRNIWQSSDRQVAVYLTDH